MDLILQLKRPKRLSIMKKFFAIIFFLLILTAHSTSFPGVQRPSGPAVDVIEKLNATLLDCMKKGHELGYSGRYALLEPAMNRSFFFPYMLRKSCGSYWKELDIENRKQLLEKYIAWSVATYTARFKEYKGQQFVVISSELVRKKYMRVISHIVKNDNKIRKFKYLLIENKGIWRIVDIQVEGVSQLSRTRSQFKSVLKDKGIEELLKILDDKRSGLELENKN
jgi:phospholipid transport system substrate-binding protein